MSLSGKKIGIAFTGSFCTYARIFEELKALQKEGAVIQTIFSNSAQRIDSRFGTAESFLKKAEEITAILSNEELFKKEIEKEILRVKKE